MKVLFIGGTGIISSACSALTVERGIDLYLLNRGRSQRLPPAGTVQLTADINDPASLERALKDHRFDAVVDWIAFTPEHIERDLNAFRGKTDQFVFISSASAYQTPPSILPVTESTVLDNPYWQYSRNKIACEERLVRAYRDEGYPVTIVRPSHTYDRTLLPFDGGFTVLHRMLEGKKVVIHGDGTSLWVLTHHRDFAEGFVGLLGNSRAIGEAFHITSDELLTWNQIYAAVARAANVELRAVHVPSETIARYDGEWGAGLLGDKANSMIFDNTKIKRTVPGFAAKIPFSRGCEEIVGYYLSDLSRHTPDERWNTLFDRIIAEAGPGAN